MDFSDYLKKGNTRLGGVRPARRCLYCGKELDRQLDHLYLQGFCTASCKNKYIDEVQNQQ